MDDERASGRRRPMMRRKVCRFCVDREIKIDYKDVKLLTGFVTERGKITPSRITGTCARHQRLVTVAVKRARNVALLPFTTVKD
jgi:small subunit ribosomal protein S18